MNSAQTSDQILFVMTKLLDTTTSTAISVRRRRMRSNHSKNQAISQRMASSDQRRGTPFQRIRTRRAGARINWQCRIRTAPSFPQRAISDCMRSSQ